MMLILEPGLASSHKSGMEGSFDGVRLLVVEDEVDLANAVARGLRRSRYAVDVAHTLQDALLRLVSAGYDLVILDWNMPDGKGVDLCHRLVDGSIPTFEDRPRVLMLTARDAVEDRVKGLDSGADDYLVKPFAFAELQARVRAILRRDEDTSPMLVVGDLKLDTTRFEVFRGDRPIRLTAKEFSLLEYLMTRAGQVLSQETLLEHVWDEAADPFTNTVRMTLSNLRKKVGEPPVIHTVPGRGYVLGADSHSKPAQ
jgi:DNA-binding response OmpR family regulator